MASRIVIALLAFNFLLVNASVYSLENQEPEEEEDDAADSQTALNALFQGQMMNSELLRATFPSLIRKKDDADTNDVSRPPPNWDEFGGIVEPFLEQEVDPGSWKVPVEVPIVDLMAGVEAKDANSVYKLGIKNLIGTPNIPQNVSAATEMLTFAANSGDVHAQSALAFLFSGGYGVPVSESKGYLHHSLAADGGSFQSQMALAFLYSRQKDYDSASEMYAKVAAKVVATNHVLRTAPLTETVHLNTGGEENLLAVRGHRGEDDEAIQFVAYKAWSGNVDDLKALGNLYYWGARGLNKDRELAFSYFKKAAEQKDSLSMAAVGEMYTFGLGVEPDYEEAMKWLTEAVKVAKAKDDMFAQVTASRTLGYLYARGLGVLQNYTQALLLFKRGAQHADSDCQYYLGVMYLRGLGVKANPKAALQMFSLAAETNHLAAVFQLARFHHLGIGTPKNLFTAAILYKSVAERGPWGSLLRWAHMSYLDKDTKTAFLLYSRAAELGYEVAQSNAGWLLEKFQGTSGCMGPLGTACTDEDRHERANLLWGLASEQGNVQAALIIGDSHYYGRGTKKDLVRAAEAYRRAKEKGNAQAMFNLGYMHEHGLGLPADFHLAKRMYDEALETEPSAALPVRLALWGLWFRQQYPDHALVRAMDSAPGMAVDFVAAVKTFLKDDSNKAISGLAVLLLSILYFRDGGRRANAAQGQR